MKHQNTSHQFSSWSVSILTTSFGWGTPYSLLVVAPLSPWVPVAGVDPIDFWGDLSSLSTNWSSWTTFRNLNRLKSSSWLRRKGKKGRHHPLTLQENILSPSHEWTCPSCSDLSEMQKELSSIEHLRTPKYHLLVWWCKKRRNPPTIRVIFRSWQSILKALMKPQVLGNNW